MLKARHKYGQLHAMRLTEGGQPELSGLIVYCSVRQLPCYIVHVAFQVRTSGRGRKHRPDYH